MKLRIFPMVGDGDNPKVSMVYISDLVNGIMAASEKKKLVFIPTLLEVKKMLTLGTKFIRSQQS